MGFKIPEHGIATGYRNGAEPQQPNAKNIAITARGEKVAKGLKVAAAVALGALAFEAFESGGHQYSTVSAKDRVAALKKADHVLNDSITILPGATLRLTPAFEDGTPQNGDPNNQAMVVEDGHVVNVSNPLTSEEHPGWVAFDLGKGKKPEAPTSDADRAKNTVWANITALENQGLAKESYSAEQPFSELPASINPNGSIGVSDPNALVTNAKIATGVDVESAGSQG